MNQSKQKKLIGISGLAAYIPPYRVWLEDWCGWTDNQWPKIREIVGRSFRVRGPNHSVYTMAANAVIRLIDQYDIDPGRVKFLGLGTESSTDNSAGAIIIKGMIDQALVARGKAPISRSCEVKALSATSLSMVQAVRPLLFAPTSPNTHAAVLVNRRRVLAQLRCCSKKTRSSQSLI